MCAFIGILLFPGSVHSESDHYAALEQSLPEVIKTQLKSKNELLDGPPELVALITGDFEGKRKARSSTLTSKKMERIFESYGEQVYPYLTYVISEMKDWRLTRRTFNYLHNISQHLSIKHTRGMRAIMIAGSMSKEDYDNYIDSNLIVAIPDFDTYPPLKSTLLFVLANSPITKDKATAVLILGNGYDPERAIEEAFVYQLKIEEKGTSLSSKIIPALLAMTYSQKYEDGFLFPETMGVIMEVFENTSHPSNFNSAAAIIGRYKPALALPLIMTRVLENKPPEIWTLIHLLKIYGAKATKYVPQLEKLSMEIKDEKLRRKLLSIIEEIKLAN